MVEKMRESRNIVYIEGWLHKKELQFESKNGKVCIMGTLEVRTDETNIIPVDVFAYELTKDGRTNTVFKGLQTVNNDYIDGTEVSNWKEATKVRITSGKIRTNEYIGKNDNEVHIAVRYTTNFVNRVNDETFTPNASFRTEIILKNMRDETRNGDETGRGIIEGYYVDFSGNIMPVNYIIDNPKMWEKIQGAIEKGSTIIVHGDIINKAETKEIVIESDFGEPERRIVTNTVRERVVKGIKYVEEGKEYIKEQIKAALEAKAKYYEQMKNDAQFNKNMNNNDDLDSDLPF